VSNNLAILNLLLTTKCNNQCSFCYEKDTYFKKIKEGVMSFDIARLAITIFLHLNNSRYKRICFMGGEPLLEINLIKKVISYIERKTEIDKNKIEYMVFTNCRLLNKENISFLKDKKVKLRINISSLFQKFYNLDFLRKILYDYPLKDGVLVINPTLSKEIKLAHSFLSSVKIKQIFCILDHNQKAWREYNVKEAGSIYKQIKDNLSKDIDLFFISPFPDISLPNRNTKDICFYRVFKSGSLTVMPNGDIFPCIICTITKNASVYDKFKIGNLREPYSLLADIKKIYLLSQKYNQKNNHIPPCLSPKLYYKQKKLLDLFQNN